MKKGYCCKHYLELLLTSFGLLYLIFFFGVLGQDCTHAKISSTFNSLRLFSLLASRDVVVSQLPLCRHLGEKNIIHLVKLYSFPFFSNFASMEFTYKLKTSVIKQLNYSVILPHAACRSNCRRIPWGTSSPG